MKWLARRAVLILPCLLGMVFPAGCSNASGPAKAELHLLIWPDYLDKTLIAQFEQETNSHVVVDNFDSGEALRAKIEHVPSGYDVMTASDEVMSSFIAEGKLEKLDLAKLPNFKNIGAAFKGMSFDPSNEYSAPFHWGTTGIAFDTRKIPVAPDSWAALFDPAMSARGTILDDPREVFAASLRLDGAPLDGFTAEQLDKAKTRILATKPKAWESSPQKMLIQGDVAIAQIWNGDAAQVAAERSGIAYVIPKEGGTLWFDNLAIAKGAPQIDLAHKFMDFLMRPEVAGANTNFKKYPSPNEAARPFIKKEILANPMIYPSESDLKRCKTLGDMKPEMKKKLLAAWTEVKGR